MSLREHVKRLFSTSFGRKHSGAREPMNGHRTVTSTSELDEILLELDAAAEVSDDELRRCFTTFSMEYPFQLNTDPYSDEYRTAQFELYERLSGKTYTPENEVSSFDVSTAIGRPFPYYTGSPEIVGNHLIAIGNVIRHMGVKPPASVLEFGPGWGNTTTFLARMGYKVTAVDIEQRFVDLIAGRAEQKQLDIECIHGDFSYIQQTDRQWDAVLFFECFHHCSDHQELIAWLDGAVAPGGKVIFAAEPITDSFPAPWGFRLDGESLWAIRNFGWCELGFQETYFRDLLARHGWSVSKTECPETPWGTVFIAKRIEPTVELIDPNMKMHFSADQLLSQVGEVEGGSRVASESAANPGFIVYGPYIEIGPGSYEFDIIYRSSLHKTEAPAHYSVDFDAGKSVLTSGVLSGTSGNRKIFQGEFVVSEINGKVVLEVRVLYQGIGDLQIHSIEIRRL